MSDMRKKFTQKQFLETIRTRKPEYDYSKAIYKGAREKVCVVCKTHGDFWISPDNLYKGKGCPRCTKYRNRPTTESFLELARKKHPEYDYSETEYTGAKSKMKIICPKHGAFWINSWNFMNKSGCPQCALEYRARARAKTTDAFIEESKRIFGDRYSYSRTEYIARNKSVIVTCGIHGDFQAVPFNYLRGCGCPKCRDGSGAEDILQQLLNESHIVFERNKKFDDLKDKKKLSYDFYLPEKRILVELNGGQHYRYIPFYHFGTHTFLVQKHHDWLKRKYAEDHNFTLVVIPYWEFKNIREKFKEFTAASS